ncbi:hypothetical protein [Actinomadura parmotrematis]|uniref:DUF4405 domain-containing protein n=1 Tax=Actinomadura parmotrematis TaxID=2864039 RepID=A0ABS7G0U3_9ACTN|nr:hypothetical protein [Actinomadura parmotrematis]MBW8486328.1 hypothetical protein [Actinomadura parmotrematis]
MKLATIVVLILAGSAMAVMAIRSASTAATVMHILAAIAFLIFAGGHIHALVKLRRKDRRPADSKRRP